MTADKRYGNETIVNIMGTFDLSSLYSIHDHILRAHPFIATSFLNPSRNDKEEEIGNSCETDDACPGKEGLDGTVQS